MEGTLAESGASVFGEAYRTLPSFSVYILPSGRQIRRVRFSGEDQEQALREEVK